MRARRRAGRCCRRLTPARSITAGQFVDPDLPLQYSFVYRRQGATNPIALNAVSTSQTLSTRLAPSDGTGGLLATCYDALGAKAYVGAQVVVSVRRLRRPPPD